ncbi:uncharacterized protein LOC109826499 [Asparagus officinalis]|uniref:uncharacterized protein LOC109826499 n=1 Tax=Asparagus officinalis TaxID=4686 RepID=UPI00098E7F13|nr:uncharacterized protein LOC109826499 [Asparagus officinalis]
MDYLSWNMNMLKHDKKFKFHPKCGKLKITHVTFADDLLLFCKGDVYSIQKLYQCVKDFGVTSNLEANLSKCSIFYGGVKDSVKSSILGCLGFPEGVFPIRYLGVPLICKRLSYVDCTPLFQKISTRVLQKIDDLCRDFLWGKTDQAFKSPLVAWDKVCKEKKYGGLGIFSAKIWNIASALRTICFTNAVWNGIMDWLQFDWKLVTGIAC